MNIFFESDKKELHAAKQVYKSILASADLLDGLRGNMCHVVTHAGSKKMLTLSRTPIPAKIAFAGGNICSRARQRIDLERAQRSLYLPPQRHRLGLQRMRTGRLRWDRATLSTFRLNLYQTRCRLRRLKPCSHKFTYLGYKRCILHHVSVNSVGEILVFVRLSSTVLYVFMSVLFTVIFAVGCLCACPFHQVRS